MNIIFIADKKHDGKGTKKQNEAVVKQ